MTQWPALLPAIGLLEVSAAPCPSIAAGLIEQCPAAEFCAHPATPDFAAFIESKPVVDGVE